MAEVIVAAWAGEYIVSSPAGVPFRQRTCSSEALPEVVFEMLSEQVRGATVAEYKPKQGTLIV